MASFWLLLGEPRARQVASRHCFRMGRGYQPRIADRRISARRFPFLVSLAFAYAHDNLGRPRIINLLSPTGEISACGFPFLVKTQLAGARSPDRGILTSYRRQARFQPGCSPSWLKPNMRARTRENAEYIKTAYRRQAGLSP